MTPRPPGGAVSSLPLGRACAPTGSNRAVGHPRSVADDRGSASIWLLGLTSVLALAVVAAVLAGSAMVLRHRAGAAADLAALAAASKAVEGQDAACAAAAGVASAMGGTLRSCSLSGLVADVEVVTGADLGLVGRVEATGRARAGPVTELAGPP